MFCDNFQRLPVPFIHAEQEKRKHDKYHAERRRTVSGAAFEQKEKRHSDKHRRGKASKLPFGKAKQYLAFYFGKVFRDRYIGQ